MHVRDNWFQFLGQRQSSSKIAVNSGFHWCREDLTQSVETSLEERHFCRPARPTIRPRGIDLTSVWQRLSHCRIDVHTSLQPPLLPSPCAPPSPAKKIEQKQPSPPFVARKQQPYEKRQCRRLVRAHQDAAGGAVVHQLADHVEVRHQGRLEDERHVRRVEQLDGESTLLAPVLLVLDLVQKNNTAAWLRVNKERPARERDGAGRYGAGSSQGLWDGLDFLYAARRRATRCTMHCTSARPKFAGSPHQHAPPPPPL